jgi:multicomponent Na+:H+ antiporter subunit D
MFWGQKRDVSEYGEYSSHGNSLMIALPIFVLALLIVVFGLYAEPLISLANATANQILDPQAYIDAVMTRVVR